MTKEDRDRAEARFNKAARAVKESRTGKNDRDAALKAAEPVAIVPVKKSRVKSPPKSGEKAPALSDWLSGQQSGGRRT